jgi:hypothetical protein
MEAVVIAAAMLVYWGGRGLTEGSYPEALSNAGRVMNLERHLGLYREIQIQDLIVDHRWLVTLMNWVYIWGHWPVIGVSAVWLFFRRPATYVLLRNAFLVSGGIGLLVFVTFPVAPPRLAGIDIVDTVTLHSEAYRVLQPPAFVNQYAAMPSLHFGWNMLIGGGVAYQCRMPVVRVVASVLPAAMAIAVVLTANHFIIDAVAGGALALFGLAVAWWLRKLAEQSTTNRRFLRRWTGLPETQ